MKERFRREINIVSVKGAVGWAPNPDEPDPALAQKQRLCKTLDSEKQKEKERKKC
jgi:hypothetical protein